MNPFDELPTRLLQVQPVLWFGLALLVALMLGEGLRRSGRVPAACAYVAVGLLAGPAGLGLIRDDSAWRQPLLDLALGVVMFELGHRVRPRWLWDNRALALTSVAEMGLAFLAVFLVLMALGGVPGTSAALVGLVAMSTAPMAVMAAIYDARTRGQVSERLLLLSAVSSLVAVVAVRMWVVIGSDRPSDGDVAADLAAAMSWSQPVYVVLLSVLLGLGVGWLTEQITRLLRLRPQPGTPLGTGRSHVTQQVVVLSVVVIGAAVATQLQLSVLLAMFIAGNMGQARVGRSLGLQPHLGTAGMVLWVFLFMSMGVSASLAGFFEVWPLVVLIVLARLAGKVAASVALARASGLTLRQGAALGVGLQPLSIVALLLSAEMLIALPGFHAPAVQAMLVACVLLELAGPWVTQFALRRIAGESTRVEPAGETTGPEQR